MTEFKKREEFEKEVYGEEVRPCFFCDPKDNRPIKEFEHWRWVDNTYPYWSSFVLRDGEYKRVSTHTLLAPKRHVWMLDELNKEEKEEFFDIYQFITDTYDKSGIYSLSFEKDGVPLKEGIYTKPTIITSYWRTRYQPRKPFEEHLHMHFAPEPPNLLKPSFDPEASSIEILDNVLELRQKNG